MFSERSAPRVRASRTTLGFRMAYWSFVNNELSVQLTASVQTDDLASGVETIDLAVPPHSSYLVAGFIYDDPESDHVIVEPNGQEITGSVGSVSALSIAGIKFFHGSESAGGHVVSAKFGQFGLFDDIERRAERSQRCNATSGRRFPLESRS